MSNYYVSTTGNDTNNGLSPLDTNAWLTINYAISQLSAGDTLYVLSGTYNENIYLEKDGTAGNLITIKAYDYNNKPHIISPSSATVVRLRGSYLNFSGFKVNTEYAQTHVKCEIGNEVTIEYLEIDAEGYLGLNGIEASNTASTGIVIRYNKVKNIEGIPIKINSNGAEIYYNLVDGFLTDATTQNIQLYISSAGNFNVYNNTLVGGLSFGAYIGHASATGNFKNNIVAYYGMTNSGAYGLWINGDATFSYDYNIITCSCLDSSRTVSGGIDGGHNYIGSEYFPNFNSLRNKGKVYLYNDDYLDKMEICAGIANAYSLPTVGAIVYTYNSAEENLAARMIALVDAGNEVCSHTTSHKSLGIGVIDYIAEVDWMRTWLSTTISGYAGNTIVYPGGLVSSDSIEYLNDNGYTCGRIGSFKNSDLRAIDVFEIPCADINKFLIDRTETGMKNFVKQHARAMACCPSISGLLTHTLGGGGNEPTETEFDWMCEALSECLEYVDVETLETLSNEIKNSGNWISADGKRWTRTNYIDNSDYTLKTSSIGVHAGVDVGLLEDLDGNLISSTPSIGSYEYSEGGFYMTEFYVTTTGAGEHDGSSEANAWDWSEMVTAINDGTVTGDSRVNLKNNATYSIGDTTITQSGSAYVWRVIEGYETDPGDGGIAYILRSSGSSHLLNFNSRNYWRLKNLKINGNNSGGINLIVGSYSQCENIESYNAGSIGLYGYALTQFLNCYSHDNTEDGFLDGKIFYCIADNNGGYGFKQVSDNCCIMYSVGKNNTSGNFQLLKGVALNIISDGGSGRGILCYYDVTLVNPILINHTSETYYALHFSDIANDAPYSCVKNVNFYNNSGLGDCNKLSYVDTYYELDPQFNNTANLDYTRTGDNLDGLGFSDVGNLGFDYNISTGISQSGITNPVYPDVSDVRDGIDRGDGNLGTLDLPSENDVQDGVSFDGATKEGNLGLPSLSDVRSGIGYGSNDTEFTGSLDLPSENDVQDGVTFDNATKEGNLGLPSENEVKSGVGYGSNDTEFSGNRTDPTESKVIEGQQYGANGTEFTGDYHETQVSEVRDGVKFGSNQENEGNVSLPIESNVKSGVGYGSNDTEYTGSYDEDYPDEDNVKDSISFGNGEYEGNRQDADVDKVLETETFGANGTEKTGTYHEANEAEVEHGITFGANEELTGSFSAVQILYPLNVQINNQTGDMIQLNLVQKEQIVISFTVTDNDGNVVDLSSSTFSLDLKSTIGASTYLAQKTNSDFTTINAENGIISVTLTTLDLNFNGYAYAILKINTGSTIDKTIFRLHLTESVE